MNNYWISWYQPTEDYRPLTYPPNKSVIGWWCSGYRDLDDAATLCAWVRAENEEEAIKTILKDWPEAEEWRFNEKRGDDWEGPGDRFTLPDWAKERVKELDS